MANLILILICFVAGILLRRSGITPASTPAVLNAFIIHISLPALVLQHIHNLTFSGVLIVPALMPWMLFALSVLLFLLLRKVFHWTPQVTGALILLSGLGNTSFLGIPMILAYYGERGVPIGLLIDQAGSFLVLSTAGIITAAALSGKSSSGRVIFKKIYTFPPLIAMVAACFLIPVSYPPAAVTVLQMLSATLAPLALVSVGYRWQLGKVKRYMKEVSFGLTFKMLLAPVLTALLMMALALPNDLLFKVTVFEAAMPPMITAAIVADEYGLEPDLAAALVGTGIPIAFVILGLVHFLLG